MPDQEPRNILDEGRFPLFCAGAGLLAVAASAFMLWVPHPRHGTSERVQGVIFVVAFLGLFVAAVYRRARRLQRDRAER